MILVRARLMPDHKRELIVYELIHTCIEDVGVHGDEVERFVSSPVLVVECASGRYW